MRVLIVGASGFLGGALSAVFGADAVGTYYRHRAAGLHYLDIRDPEAVQRLVTTVEPEVVIHPAAQPHVDWCEEHVDESAAINVAGTRHVALAAAAVGARFVYFSTDYVFDGRDGPYPEDAMPRPLNVYGRHKLQAERLIAESLDDHLIVRVCGVYGFEPRPRNFIMTLVTRGQRREPLFVPTDQWGTPTYVDNLAQAVRELVHTGAHGLYHVVGPDFLDRFSFAQLGCEILGLDPGFLRPRTTRELAQRAARPLRAGLDAAKARASLSADLLTPRRGLDLMRTRLCAEGVLPCRA